MDHRDMRGKAGEKMVGTALSKKAVFLPNEPNWKMRIYLGMNVVGKIRVGFVLQKRGKKEGESAKKGTGKVFFWTKKPKNEGNRNCQRRLGSVPGWPK